MMPNYSYKAADSSGRLRRGCLEAANIVDLEQRLLGMRLDLVTCRSIGQRGFFPGRRRVSRGELINFCFHLEQFSRAGISLLEALAELRDSMEHRCFRETVASLLDQVEGGSTLSAAMAVHPRVFDSLFVGLVRAGEISGRMPETFSSLAAILKWQNELIVRSKKILLLPAVVALLLSAVTIFLLIYLVPRLVHFVLEMGHSLPWYTRALITVSDFFIHYWYAIILAPLLFGMLLRFLARHREGVRFFFDGQKLKLWLVGPLLGKMILSRFTGSFALLYGAGIPILHCLEICQGLVGNMVVADACKQVAADINQGQDVAASFAHTGLFPPLIIRMLKIGEATGELDQALRNVSFQYDRDVKELLDRLQSLLEPAMTVVLGLILGWVMLAVLGPIYDTIGQAAF